MSMKVLCQRRRRKTTLRRWESAKAALSAIRWMVRCNVPLNEGTMKRLWSYRWLRVVAVLAALSLTGLLGCAWYFRVWSWRDYEILGYMDHECHPVWKELFWRRVYAGQSVEEVIAETKPLTVERFENFVVLHYTPGGFTGIGIVARDGKLVWAEAYSCAWTKPFFNEFTPAEWQAFGSAQLKHYQSKMQPND